MLMPLRTSRSLDAHLTWFIAARKSAMMGAYGSSEAVIAGVAPAASAAGLLVRTT